MSNYIGLVNEYAQKKKIAFPVYIVNQEGPSHSPIFTCTLRFDDNVFEETANSVKSAKHLCAKKCVEFLQIQDFLDNECLSNGNVLKVVLLSENAILPSRATEFSAGYDLSTPADIIIPAWTRKLVKTDLAIKVPGGTYGRIAGRSSLAFKNSIDVAGGVIDEDYTGNVGVILCNNSNVDYIAQQGDRIAQLIIEKIAKPNVIQVMELTESDRGAGGFGSTGK